MKQSDVVLFMKGDRDTPRYVPRGFSSLYPFVLTSLPSLQMRFLAEDRRHSRQ